MTHDRKCRFGLTVDVGNSEQMAVTAARNKYRGWFFCPKAVGIHLKTDETKKRVHARTRIVTTMYH